MKSKRKNVLYWVGVFFFVVAVVISCNSISAKAAGTGAVSITGAVIEGANVKVSVSASDFPDSDDGTFYLYAEKVYQIGPSGSAIASLPMGANVTFQVPLGFNTAGSRLYDKFQVAVIQGGKLVAVTNPRYITNPEVLATNSPAVMNNGKKGIILDGAKIGNGNTEVLDLGVQQAAYNINLEDVIGGDGAIKYEYNGKVYGFDSSYMSQYDHCVRITSSQKIGLTMVLLNPYARGEEFMIAPSSRGGIGRCSYYMMNTSEDKGLEYLEAVVSFLAERYNGHNGVGQIDNWVIGNEVNAKNAWNYSSVSDELSYAQLYADSLRVCYNAIKSKNANATVCISLDQNWTKIHNSSYFSARSMLEAINAVVVAQGNFDWAVAEHPYNYPMTWTSFWTPKNAEAVTMIQHSIDTPYLSMENIEQLTDYLCLPAMRNTKGQVRPVLLTEIGYSSSQGEEAQAAAMVYAYQRTMTNRYIKMIIFNRQTDFHLEVKNGLSVGLSTQDGRRKMAYDYFKNMNGSDSGAYIQKAAAYMGIGDWNAAMNAR
ncbi:DUF5722 domain-containing protein [Butyrivibrio sp. YAB3001]|uniref:DUF5722 domain-containing protein n=1 Tax=Butyrivibrio sp. YAB3001 TaxID=1520812 RepID=UPI0008F66423|nr:DUF5722 domain-containing protein [Butyrivibrio sp. YAB3001]SFC93112.1 hypothetical protein SAMN02910398_03561 [Butyrivibrio sp. YAB3001]